MSLQNSFDIGVYPYVVVQIIMIYFFSYFWTTVVFSPEDMAKQLRDHGSFIPGLRPVFCRFRDSMTLIGLITYVYWIWINCLSIC